MIGRKRFFLFAAALLLTWLAVSGCGGGGGEENEAGPATATGGPQLKLAVFIPAKNSYTVAVADYGQADAKALGGTADVFDADSNAQTQASQLQDAVATGKYNAFLIVAFDAQGIVPFVQDSIDAGIKVAAETFPIGPDPNSADIQIEGLTSSAGNPGLLDGQTLGNGVVEACGQLDPCKVIYMAGDLAYSYDQGVRDGWKKVFADHPTVSVVGVGEGKFVADSAFTAARDLLQTHPDVNVIFAMADDMVNGIERAVEDSGLKAGGPDGIKLIGNGGSEAAAENIKKGTWYSSLIWLPKTSVEFNVKNLDRAVKGEPIPKPQAVYTTRDLSPIGFFLNADSLEKGFEPQYRGG